MERSGLSGEEPHFNRSQRCCRQLTRIPSFIEVSNYSTFANVALQHFAKKILGADRSLLAAELIEYD
jgi:hypothetical protein